MLIYPINDGYREPELHGKYPTVKIEFIQLNKIKEEAYLKLFVNTVLKGYQESLLN